MGRKRVEMYEDILPDGRCKYRMPYKDPLTDKNRTISVIMDKATSSNYKIAKRYLDDKLEKIIKEAEHTDITVEELARLYLEERATVVKASTLHRNTWAIDTMIDWIGRDVYISRLSVPYLKYALKEHTDKAVTYNEFLKRLKTMLNWAYMNDYLKDRSLYDKLQYLPDNKKDRIEDKYLEKEELDYLLEAASHPLWKLVTEFLVTSGLRIGELIALQDNDIDSEYIHISKTYETGVNIISTPKTKESIRDVYLRPELKKSVKKIRTYMREYKFSNGIKSDFFICDQDGNIFHYDAYRKWLKETSGELLQHPITPHALRHTAASLLIADGVPLETVSRMLGHANSRITKEIYIHITQELRNKDNEVLNNASIL